MSLCQCISWDTCLSPVRWQAIHSPNLMTQVRGVVEMTSQCLFLLHVTTFTQSTWRINVETNKVKCQPHSDRKSRYHLLFTSLSLSFYVSLFTLFSINRKRYLSQEETLISHFWLNRPEINYSWELYLSTSWIGFSTPTINTTILVLCWSRVFNCKRYK